MSLTEKLNQSVKSKNHITIIIIVAIIIIFLGSLLTFLFFYNIGLEALKLYEAADAKLRDFDDQSNIYSKQEMEKMVIEALNKVIVRYPNTASGKKSQFYKAYVYYNTANYQEAIKNFKIFVNKYENNILAPKAYYMLSYCYSNEKKYKEAIKSLEIFQDEKQKNSFYAPLSIYRIAELYEKLDDKQNAMKYYKILIDDYSESSQIKMAKKKLVILKNNLEL